MKMRNVSFSVALLLLTFMMGATVSAGVGESILGKQSTAEAAACGRCGDGYCAKQCGENAQNCPKDCGVEEALQACARCGDGVCAKSCETAQSCPKDCGVESQSIIPNAQP